MKDDAVYYCRAAGYGQQYSLALIAASTNDYERARTLDSQVWAWIHNNPGSGKSPCDVLAQIGDAS